MSQFGQSFRSPSPATGPQVIFLRRWAAERMSETKPVVRCLTSDSEETKREGCLHGCAGSTRLLGSFMCVADILFAVRERC